MKLSFFIPRSGVKKLFVWRSFANGMKNAMHDVQHTKSMSVAGVSGARKDVKTEAQLANPAQSLIIRCVENSSFNPIENNVAVNIVVHLTLKKLTHRIIIGRTSLFCLWV